jgi:hypothetical protein
VPAVAAWVVLTLPLLSQHLRAAENLFVEAAPVSRHDAVCELILTWDYVGLTGDGDVDVLDNFVVLSQPLIRRVVRSQPCCCVSVDGSAAGDGGIGVTRW